MDPTIPDLDAPPTDDARFVRTIAAVAVADQCQWKIGDALQEDLENAVRGGTAPRAFYKKCAEQLVAKGYDRYDRSYLGKLHRTARAFGHNKRDPDLPWDAHYEAGSPENLRRAAAMLRDGGQSVTGRNVRFLMERWRDEIAADRREQHEAAKVAAAEAKQKVKAASEKKLQAGKDKAAREQAECERQAAKREVAEARKRAEETVGPPPFNADVDPQPPSTLVEGTGLAGAVYIATCMAVEADYDFIGRYLRKILQRLKELGGLGNLPPMWAKGIITRNNRVMRQAAEIDAQRSPRDRFQVVRDSDNEGTS